MLIDFKKFYSIYTNSEAVCIVVSPKLLTYNMSVMICFFFFEFSCSERYRYFYKKCVFFVGRSGNNS